MSEIRRHFRVHAYVCRGGKIVFPTIEGWATFAEIVSNGPVSMCCVIVEKAPGTFGVWDMRYDMFDYLASRPPPTLEWPGPNADAITMKAVALYG